MRLCTFSLVLACSFGCAPRPSAAPSLAVDGGAATSGAREPEAAATKFAEALQRARAQRRQAEALAFIVPSKASSSDARVEAFGDWLRPRSEATDRAEAAYVAARELATPSEQVLVERERGELFIGLFEAQVQASLSIFPDVQHASTEKLAMLRAQLGKTFLPVAGKARERFVACLMLSNQLGSKNADTTQCEAQIRRIDALVAPTEKREPALDDWRFARVDDAPRSRRPVTRGSGCAFRGSAWSNGWLKLYTDATGQDFNFVLEDFDVIELELPARRDQRAKLSIDYPFKASGYIEPDSQIIETDARVDLVPKHLWLNTHSGVRAYAIDRGQVHIEREANEKSEPAVALRVACSQLTLAQERQLARGEVKGETSQVSGVVPLFAAPGGKPIGRLDSDLAVNVRVLARERGWVHITTTDAGVGFSTPYEFDAWVLERFAPAGKEGFAIYTAGPTTSSATHVTSGLLPLRLSPDPKALVVAELVSGVPLIAGSERGGMRRIRFNQAHGRNEGNDFWVTRADFSRQTVVAKTKKAR
ncbi:MAG TPA: hypothetical protein VER12_00730 [Polyangiaceae bacterium]|nr:hypothetical protein [Polyangiaceae bacterium]